MDLPLLLAGPMLRRVEPTLVTVWVALREPASVRVKLWRGRVDAGSGEMLAATPAPGAATRRIGARLHVVAATLEITPGTAQELQPGQLYAYDLEITAAGGSHTLQSLGLLASGLHEGRRVEALGHADGKLPCFALPPSDLTQLRVLFGSCRLPNNDHPDALAWIDDLMRDAEGCPHDDALRRPHRLFLGGDQIYADDVSPVHLHQLNGLACELIGQSGTVPVERLPVSVRQATLAEPTGFADYGADAVPGALPADLAHFPAARRMLLGTVEAQMTSADGFCHLFSLGEFAAMYLSVWSNAVWPPAATPGALPLATDDELNRAQWPAAIPAWVDAPLGLAADPRAAAAPAASPLRHYESYGQGADLAAEWRHHRERMQRFAAGLAKVRRVLANVPTYMMFDDHDVTDDWNLNPTWQRRVYASALGVTTVRNALTAYALFQDWGNDPRRYLQGPHKDLLDQAERLFPAGAAQGPAVAPAAALDTLFGLALRAAPDPLSGRVPATSPPLKWHYALPGPGHQTLVLDNRTRRSFVSDMGPPGNVEGRLDPAVATAQAEQIPAGPLADGREVLLVVAPLQVLGPPVFDELLAPASYRVVDMVHHTKGGQAGPGRAEGGRGMVGTNPDAIEAWAFDHESFEALLRRLAPYGQVVLLSGDVHYSASTVMSYWQRGQAAPARFAQFTNSGFKNVMPGEIQQASRSLSILQRMIRSRLGAERLGWNGVPLQPVLLDPAFATKDIPRALRGRMKQAPVMLPTFAWPPGSKVNPAELPDWSWRVEPVFDLRPDVAPDGASGPAAVRPAALRALPIDAAGVAMQLSESGAPQAVHAYRTVAARHGHALGQLRNTRQILFRSNFGLLRFERREQRLHAIHAMYSVAPPLASPERPARPEALVWHQVALSAVAAERPEVQPLKPVKP